MTASSIIIALDIVEIPVFELGVRISVEFWNAFFSEPLFRAFCALLNLVLFRPNFWIYLECEANTIQRIYWSSFSWIRKWSVANVRAIAAISRNSALVERSTERVNDWKGDLSHTRQISLPLLQIGRIFLGQPYARFLEYLYSFTFVWKLLNFLIDLFKIIPDFAWARLTRLKTFILSLLKI